mmetsp:Transcript_1876/g.5662  ORF Transcript_1876/g.5662 Transcript_1876/m.5662 type:complete len:187 (+) Transcript_1876:83-643(+)
MSNQLKNAIQRATTPSEETDEGDPIALIELTEILGQNQKLAGDAVKLIKARIKDKDPRISSISMEVLDACMQTGGQAVQEIVAKKALDRMRRIGAGGAQIPEALRNKASNLLLNVYSPSPFLLPPFPFLFSPPPLLTSGSSPAYLCCCLGGAMNTGSTPSSSRSRRLPRRFSTSRTKRLAWRTRRP